VELAGRSADMEGEDDESRELWGRMQEAAWQRDEVPPVVNREWWALASAGRRLKAALSAFLEYAEQAGGVPLMVEKRGRGLPMADPMRRG
jgi:hypothetical protein